MYSAIFAFSNAESKLFGICPSLRAAYTMFPEGPTTTTVAPPVGLAAREYVTHASASFRAVSRLISCRCARLVASGDIVTCARVNGGFCGVGSGGLVWADTLAQPSAMSTISTRNVILSSESITAHWEERRRYLHDLA